MAQRKPEEQVTLSQVLKLAHQLTPDEQSKLLAQLKIEELQRALQIGIDEADRGQLVSEEQVLQHLDACHKEAIQRQK
jgi:predicted transcriptional regulator